MAWQWGIMANHYFLLRPTTTTASFYFLMQMITSTVWMQKPFTSLCASQRVYTSEGSSCLRTGQFSWTQSPSVILFIFTLLKESWKGDCPCLCFSFVLTGPGHSCWHSYCVLISLVQRLIKSCQRARFPMKLKQITVCVMDAQVLMDQLQCRWELICCWVEKLLF